MTSKNSFSKYILADLKSRSWLPAVSSILLFLASPAFITLWLDGNRAAIAEQKYNWIREAFPGMLCGNMALFPVIGFLAMACAFTGFARMHDPVCVDFYHSLPRTRTQQFLATYTAGFLTYVIPYVIASLLSIAVGGFFHIYMEKMLAASFVSILAGILEFLVIYHVSILGMMLTGRVLPGVLASCVLLVYTQILDTTLFELCSTFFSTFFGSRFSESLLVCLLSPVGWFISFFGLSNLEWSLPYLAVSLIGLIAVFAISLLLCRIRCSEAAGRALAFPKTASLIKYMIVVPMALLLGVFTGELSGSGNLAWCIFWSLFDAVLLCLIIEFIYHPDLRLVLDRKPASIAAVATVAVILAVFSMDLIGYDTWLPKKENISTIAVSNGSLSSYLGYDSMWIMLNDQNYDMLYGPNRQYTDWEPLYELAAQGVGHVGEDTEFARDLVDIEMRFVTNSGKEYLRRYQVNKDELLDACDTLCTDPEVRKAFIPLYELDASRITSINYNDLEITGQTLDIPAEEFLNAYRQDLSVISLRELEYEIPIASFELHVLQNMDSDPAAYDPMLSTKPYAGWEDTWFYGTFYIYESCASTLNCLEKYDVSVHRTLPDLPVKSVIYHCWQDTGNGSADSVAEITDPDEQRALMGRVIFTQAHLLGWSNDDEWLDVTYTNSSETHTYPLKNMLK